MSSCGASTFDDVTVPTLETLNQAGLEYELGLVEQFSGADLSTDAIITAATSYSAFFVLVWPLLCVVFVVLAALPLACARCCCTRKCCPPKDYTYVEGYPACGACGYIAPTLVFTILWIVAAILSILAPFQFQAIADAGMGFIDTMCASFDLASDLVDELVGALSSLLTTVRSIVNGALLDIEALIDRLISQLRDVDTTISTISDELVADCNDIVSSAAYQNLTQLTDSGVLTFDCNSLAVSTSTNDDVEALITTLDDVKDELPAINDTVNGVLNFTDTIYDSINGAQDMISSIRDDILNTTVSLDAISTLIDEGDYTLSELDELLISSIFAKAASIFLVFVYLSLLGWLIGLLALCCIKRTDDGRAKKVRNGCCGRCLMKCGCTCGLFGVFIICLSLVLVALILSLTFNVVADFYYLAPGAAGTLIDSFVDADSLGNASQFLGNATGIIDECFFGDGSLTTAAATLGFDLNEIISSFTGDAGDLGGDDLLNLDFDISGSVKSAEDGITAAQAALESERFTDAELAFAQSASEQCCNYSSLFSLFALNCDNSTSVCGACQALADAGDCVAAPNLCDPSASLNPDYATFCNNIAKNAFSVMTQQRALVDDQSPNFDTLRGIINDINASDPLAETNDILTNSIDSLQSSTLNLLDGLSCSSIGVLYYGIYETLLQPLAATTYAFGVIMALIPLFLIVMAFVAIPVNVRLGNDGIDPNNIPDGRQDDKLTPDYSPDPNSSEEVAIELSEVHHGAALPVAEPVREVSDEQAATTPEDTTPEDSHYPKVTGPPANYTKNITVDDYGGNDDYHY